MLVLVLVIVIVLVIVRVIGYPPPSPNPAAHAQYTARRAGGFFPTLLLREMAGQERPAVTVPMPPDDWFDYDYDYDYEHAYEHEHDGRGITLVARRGW